LSDERVAFSATEYRADGSMGPAAFVLSGSAADGWEFLREGRLHLRLGPGYELLRTSHCGICSTDLARRHLPFPLPQVIGHEAVAIDRSGASAVVEINASHAGRGLSREQWCAHCRNQLDHHCPERLVLGIHDLPGGFSPWLLAPAGGIVPLPAAISPRTATLIEPFAAALHAVTSLAPRRGDRVAVLGPRRLGSLVIAALAAWRRHCNGQYEILAVARREEMRQLARRLGADLVLEAQAAATMHDVAEIVVDTTGDPQGLVLASQLAGREVHVKSTTGRPAFGLTHVTDLVVDELTLARYPDAAHRQGESLAGELERTVLSSSSARIAAITDESLAGQLKPDLEKRGFSVYVGDPSSLASRLAADQGAPLGGADLAVVSSLAQIDTVIRPRPGIERGLIRARGTIFVADAGQPRDGLLAAVLDRGLRFSSSRCGDFHAAAALLADGPLAQELGELMVTDILPAERLAEAFAAAAGPRSVKVVVTHPDSRL
jgi:threonine dehydrogenase-like Zn-dependent dehydrogenase